jgi:hypothetical protein
MSEEAMQTLGRALGLPQLFPYVSKTDDQTVCTGPHTIETLAAESAEVINALRQLLARTGLEISSLRRTRQEFLPEDLQLQNQAIVEENRELTATVERQARLLGQLEQRYSSIWRALYEHASFIESPEIDLTLAEFCAGFPDCACATCSLQRLRNSLRRIVSAGPFHTDEQKD